MAEESSRVIQWIARLNAKQAQREAAKTKDSFEDLRESTEKNEKADKSAARAASERARAERDLGKSARDAGKDIKGLAQARRDVANAEKYAATTTSALVRAQSQAAAAAKNHGKTSKEHASALRDVAQAEREAEQGALRLSRAMQGLTPSINRNRSGLRGLVQDLQQLSSASGGAGRNLNLLGREASSAGARMRSMRLLTTVAQFTAIGAAIMPLLGLISSLAAGLGALVPAITSVVQAAAAGPGALLAFGSAISTLLVGFQGIGGALKANTKLQEASTAASKSAAKIALELAQKTRAVEKAQDGLADANRNVKQTQDELVASAKRVKQAQDALTQARIDAKRAIEDLRDAEANRALDAEQADINVERARRALNATLADPGASGLDRKEAELNYRQALQAQKDLTKEQKRAREDVAREDRRGKGVEGSPEVTGAKDDLKEAQKSFADAKRAIDEAKDAVKDAKLQVREAKLALKEFGTEGTAAQKAADEFAAAMAKLSPAAQTFVRTLIGMKSKWDDIKFAAQEGLFPGLTTALTTLAPLSDSVAVAFGKMGEELGSIASQVATTIASFLQMQAVGSKVSNMTFLTDHSVELTSIMGDALNNVIEALLNLTVAAAPFTTWLFEAVRGWTLMWKEMAIAGNQSGSTRKRLEELKETMQQWGRIISNTYRAMRTFFGESEESSKSLMDSLEETTKRWEEMAEAGKKNGSIKDWFNNGGETLKEVGLLLGDILKIMFRVGSDPGIPKLVEKIRKELLPAVDRLLTALTEAVGPHMLNAIIAFTEAFANILEGGGGDVLSAMWTGVEALAKALERLTQIPGVPTFFGALISGLIAFKAIKLAGAITGITSLTKAILGLNAAQAASGGVGVVGGTRGKHKGAPAGGVVPVGAPGGKHKGVPGASKAAGGGVLAGAGGKVMGAAEKGASKLAKLKFAPGPWALALIIFSNLGEIFERIQPALDGLGKAFGQLGQAFSGAAGPASKFWKVIKPVFDFIIGMVVDAVVGVLNGVIWAITGIVKVIAGVVNVIAGILTGDLGRIWTGVKQIFFGAIQAIGGALWAWVNVGLLKVFGGLFKIIMVPIKAGWGAIKKFFVENGASIVGRLRGVFGVVKNVITAPFRGAWSLLKTIWNGITNTISGAWSKISGLFTKMKSGVGTLKDKFKEMGGEIKSIWGDVKNKVASAITAIINVINRILRAVGAPEIRTSSTKKARGGVIKPKKFARGGSANVVPGLGNRDSVPALLMPGEFIMRRNAVKRIGVNQLNAMNEGRSYRGVRHYAQGGSVGDGPKTGGFLGGVVGRVGEWAGDKVGRVGDILEKGAKKAAELALAPLKAAWNGFGRTPLGDMIRGLGGKLWTSIPRFAGSQEEAYGASLARKTGIRPKGRITSPYGPRATGFHTGTDFTAGGRGAKITPVAPGKISSVRHLRTSYGNHVVMTHAGGFSSLYAHMSKTAATDGRSATTKSLLGYVGSSGNSTGPHLHLEIRKGGKHRNPMNYLKKGRGGAVSAMLTPGEMIMNPDAVSRYGVSTFAKMNRTPRRFAMGGFVGGMRQHGPSVRGGGGLSGLRRSGADSWGSGSGTRVYAPVINNPRPERASRSTKKALRDGIFEKAWNE